MTTPATDWGRFGIADTTPRHRLVFSSFGPEGSGKTHLGLSAPGPVAVMQFDPRGIEGVAKKFPGKEIRIIEYNFNPVKLRREIRQGILAETPTIDLKELDNRVAEKLHDVAVALKDQFLEDYARALKLARTIIWDKEDYVWEMMRYASFGDNTDKPSNYYELNMEYRGLIQEALDSGVNLQLIRGLKEKWGLVGGKLTALGEMQQRGMKEVPELVQACIEHWWDEDAKQFKIQIHKCKQNSVLRGKEYTNADFLTLALDVFPETMANPEVWDSGRR